MISAERIEEILRKAHDQAKALPTYRYGQAVFNIMRESGEIKSNPAYGSLGDFVAGEVADPWVKEDGTTFPDMFELRDPEYVRAIMYSNFWSGAV